MNWCPVCNRMSFDYDPRFRAYRCFYTDCLIIDYDREYGEGLTTKRREKSK